jgi:hypothetical protein
MRTSKVGDELDKSETETFDCCNLTNLCREQFNEVGSRGNSNKKVKKEREKALSMTSIPVDKDQKKKECNS